LSAPLLSVRDLSVAFRMRFGTVHALDGISFDVAPGEVLGVVGESGSGKTVTAHAILGLLGATARVTAGQVLFAGQDLLRLPRARMDAMRGRELSIVFQHPRTALNPIRPVGQQIADVIARHDPAPPAAIRAKVLDALRRMRIPDPERRMRALSHELSGGMCGRVGIAVAIACAPRLLLADEPTTGLDVTTQAVVMDLLRDAVRSRGAAAVLITHDLALASEYCDRIVVMHAGQVVESAPVAAIFATPRHPFTAGLLAGIPAAVASIDELRPINGAPPDLRREDLPPCRFSERCGRVQPHCNASRLALELVGPDHAVACRRPL
jgi:oligopeptide/dipeptide ABC transporter ATP-binding protein